MGETLIHPVQGGILKRKVVEGLLEEVAFEQRLEVREIWRKRRGTSKSKGPEAGWA